MPLLKDSSIEIRQAATGSIQNLTRDVRAREIAISCGAVELISELLVSSDIPCQIAAMGCLLNLVGPSISADDKKSFHSLLSEAIALGAINSCLFDTNR